MHMNRPKVLLAEDHPAVAQSLAFLLNTMVEIVATVRDGRALIESAKHLQLDLIIADIQMPVMDGLEALRELRRQGLHVPVLLLTAYDAEELVDDAMCAGANGLVLKHTAGDELLTAIGEVLQGRDYLSRRHS